MLCGKGLVYLFSKTIVGKPYCKRNLQYADCRFPYIELADSVECNCLFAINSLFFLRQVLITAKETENERQIVVKYVKQNVNSIGTAFVDAYYGALGNHEPTILSV